MDYTHVWQPNPDDMIVAHVDSGEEDLSERITIHFDEIIHHAGDFQTHLGVFTDT